MGWSANTAAMVGSQWFFLDESVSTEAFDQLTAYLRSTRDMSLSARAGEAAQVLAAFPADNPAVMPSLWLLAAVIVLSAAGAALLPRGGRFRMLGALLLTVLLAAAMLCYLAFDKGRLPLRAALMALLPAAAMIFGLLPCALCGRGARALTALCTAACLGLCAWHLALQLPSLLPDEAHEAEFGNPVNDLLEYALMNEDMPVSYTHLDVYKRQLLHIDAYLARKLGGGSGGAAGDADIGRGQRADSAHRRDVYKRQPSG